MAITKILNIQESEGRNPTTHLEVFWKFFQNPDKIRRMCTGGRY